MSNLSKKTPAEEAAQKAQEAISACLADGKSFRLEAGAGAGKTHSLIEALKELISKRGKELLRNRQQIACITYTNAASDEIQSRIDKHPAVLASTIHAFCWSLIRDFQPYLRVTIPTLKNWPEKLAEEGGNVGTRRVEYELGHRTVNDAQVSIGHNDVITLTVGLMEQPKFRLLLAARFPILFIDEYQDTNAAFAEALKKHFLSKAEGPLIGFFGDHWQKIYNDVCGKIEHDALVSIDKGSNFRSVPVIVEVLNKMRPALTQAVSNPEEQGTVAVYHTNDWKGARRTENHWQGDLPATEAHQFLEKLKAQLITQGWSFEGNTTKILMLTHGLLAKEQGYSSFGDVFDYSESYINKEDAFIEFLVDKVEPVCAAYKGKRYGEMFAALDARTPSITQHAEKQQWTTQLDELLTLRDTGTIGAVLDHLKKTARPRLTDRLERKLSEYEVYSKGDKKEEDKKHETLGKLREVKYSELMALDRYIDDKTPFSTKHGVKGQQFENVLVVCGRSWNQYDFNQMLEWFSNGVPKGKDATFERNRNLFYVACSRPKKRLALLFTEQLSPTALTKLTNWFGEASVHTLGPNPL